MYGPRVVSLLKHLWSYSGPLYMYIPLQFVVFITGLRGPVVKSADS